MADAGWIRTARGLRKSYGPARLPVARGAFPCPMLALDTCAAVRSMADGRVYDSKAGLRRSHRADGNPAGRDYTEIGDAPVEVQAPPKPDRRAIRGALERAANDVRDGNVPAHIRAIGGGT